MEEDPLLDCFIECMESDSPMEEARCAAECLLGIRAPSGGEEAPRPLARPLVKPKVSAPV